MEAQKTPASMETPTDQELFDTLLASGGCGRDEKRKALREIFKRGALQAARAIASNSITIRATAQVIEHNLNQLQEPKETRTFGP